MKRMIYAVCLLGLVWMCLACDGQAASVTKKKDSSMFSPSGLSKGMSNTVKGIEEGTKSFVQGAIDLITLKPFRKTKRARIPKANQPWLNNTYKKKQPKEEKKSLWSSLFPPKEKPKKVNTMQDFIGLKRPQ